MGILFTIFWLWVVVAGMRAVAGRFGQLWNWLCTPWGSATDNLPALRGPIGQEWSRDEYRHYSSLAASTPVPAIPEVMTGMKQALDDEKRTARKLGDDIAEWQHAIEQLNRSVAMWTEKAANALAAGQNDLARAAIVERQRTQERIRALESDVAEMRRLLTTHSSDIQHLEGELSTIYRRHHLAETRLSAAETSVRAREMLYGEHVKDALSRFEDLERKADLAEGRADALALGSQTLEDPTSIDAQLAALSQSAPGTPAFTPPRAPALPQGDATSIDAQLAALSQRVAAGSASQSPEASPSQPATSPSGPAPQLLPTPAAGFGRKGVASA